MADHDPHAVIADALAEIAPDVDPARTDGDLHDDLGLDSMDLLNLATAIAQRTGVDIPEHDRSGLRTIAQLAAYLDAHMVR